MNIVINLKCVLFPTFDVSHMCYTSFHTSIHIPACLGFTPPFCHLRTRTLSTKLPSQSVFISMLPLPIACLYKRRNDGIHHLPNSQRPDTLFIQISQATMTETTLHAVLIGIMFVLTHASPDALQMDGPTNAYTDWVVVAMCRTHCFRKVNI